MGQNRRVTSVRTVLPPEVPECQDPFDRQFLELALAGNAAVLVTGDVDLLASADRFAVPILSSRKFGRFLEHTPDFNSIASRHISQRTVSCQ